MIKQCSIILLSLFFMTSCMEDEQLWEFNTTDLDKPTKGLFVINEGNFMYENASLSYYDMEHQEVTHSAFYETNALPLGDVAQSMTIRDSLGYVMLNNSGKIYAFNTNTFEFQGKITGLTSPRYMHFINDSKAYVSDMYARCIWIVNPQTFELTGSIDVSNENDQYSQHSPEQMVQYGKYVFVNCWNYDDDILVIDSENDTVVNALEVLKQPNSMVMDNRENLWVLADGGYEGNPYAHIKPGLMRIDAASLEVEKTWRFDKQDHPSELQINSSGDTLYFLNGHIYRHPVRSDEKPELFIESPHDNNPMSGFYGLGIDPATSEIYVSDALDHSQPGVVYRYRPNGMAVDTFKVGIIPGSFCFKP